MAQIGSLKTWSLNELLTSADLNANFSEIKTKVNTYCLFKDTASTIAAVYTFSQAPVFQTAFTMGGKLTVSTGGAEINGQLNQIGTLSVTGAVGVSQTLACTGNFTAAAAATVGTTLSVAGQVTLGASAPIVSDSTATFAGGVTAGSFFGIGTGLTALSAANISSGGTLPALNGAALTALNASNIASGTLDSGRLNTALGVRTFTELTSDESDLGVATATSLAVSTATINEGLTLNKTGSADSVELLTTTSDGVVSSTPPAGVSRYLRISYNGALYKILMQKDT